MMEETLVVLVRAVITFSSLLIYTRMLGKQQMGNLSFFDYINGITIGSIGAALATDLSTKAWVHWVGLTTFILITFMMQWLTLKSRKFSKIADSEPTVVIQEGKILEENLMKMRVKKDELMVLLRQQGIFDITHTQFALLEPNGRLSVMPKENFRPVLTGDLKLLSKKLQLTTEVIYDGEILLGNLRERGKSEAWLMKELEFREISRLADISYAAILPDGKLYIDKINDEMNQPINLSDYDGQE